MWTLRDIPTKVMLGPRDGMPRRLAGTGAGGALASQATRDETCWVSNTGLAGVRE
ncbi:hypothetical protein L6Q96_20915 [Candidatus Binatia bacterium]|nr:hypothetical protein [Candidatus Binatia bacterium]